MALPTPRWPVHRRHQQGTRAATAIASGSGSSKMSRRNGGKADGEAWRARADVSVRGATSLGDMAPDSSNNKQQPQQQMHASGKVLRVPWSWEPRLTLAEVALTLLASAIPCVLIYVAAPPARFSPEFAAGMAIIYAVLCAAVRGVLLERQHAERAKDFHLLGDSDSLFPTLAPQLQVHVKANTAPALTQRLEAALKHHLAAQHAQQPPQQRQPGADAPSGAGRGSQAKQQRKSGEASAQQQPSQQQELSFVAAHCFHGFGANLYSYVRVQSALAKALGGVATSHDMPGFGLTQRPTDLKAYQLDFNGQLGCRVADWKAAQLVKACAAPAHLTLATAAATRSSDEGGLRQDPTPSRLSPPSTAPHQQQQQLGKERQREEGRESMSPAPAGSLSEEDLTLALSPATSATLPPQATYQKQPSPAPAPPRLLPSQRAGGNVVIKCNGGGAESPSSVLRGAQQALSGASTPVTGNASLDEPPPALRATGAAAANPAGAGVVAEVRVRKVLVGHSLGGLCAALAALDRPEEVSALVLVAPAILAMPGRGDGSGDGGEAAALELRPLPTGPSGWVAAQEARGGAAGKAAAKAAPPLHSHPILLDEGGEGGEHEVEAAGAQDAVTGDGDAPARLALPWGLVDRYECCEVDGGGATEGKGRAGVKGGEGKRRAGLPLLARLFSGVMATLRVVLVVAALMLLRLLRPAIVALLRVLVRSRPFWLRGLQSAYYDPSQVTDQVVDAYSLPQLVRGWEAGMFMFLAARVASSLPPKALGAASWLAGFSATAAAAPAQEGGRAAAKGVGDVSAAELEVATASAAAAEEGTSLASRLASLCRRRRLPVLIIHGVHDMLVPASNSRRLAAMLPGCELALLQRCGHMPQEEWPLPFVELVREFVQRRAGHSQAGKTLRLVAAPQPLV